MGALFQLHVALFQLGLLFFQVALRLQQAAALLFQFFVGHAQLFLLGLQPPWRCDSSSSTTSCARSSDARSAMPTVSAQRSEVRDPGHAFAHLGATQLDDHRAIAADRRQDALAHRQPAEAGLFKHGGIIAVQVADAFITSDLPGQPS